MKQSIDTTLMPMAVYVKNTSDNELIVRANLKEGFIECSKGEQTNRVVVPLTPDSESIIESSLLEDVIARETLFKEQDAEVWVSGDFVAREASLARICVLNHHISLEEILNEKMAVIEKYSDNIKDALASFLKKEVQDYPKFYLMPETIQFNEVGRGYICRVANYISPYQHQNWVLDVLMDKGFVNDVTCITYIVKPKTSIRITVF